MGSQPPRRKRRIIAGVMIEIAVVAMAFVPHLAAVALDDLVAPAPFWRLRFEVLAGTPKGQHYIQLHDSNGREIVQIVIDHPDLYMRSLRVLSDWQPNIEALVNGQGDKVIITETLANEAIDYLEILSRHASPGLLAVIQAERAITPLEGTVGMSMNEAWEYLNHDPRFEFQPEDRRESTPPRVDEGRVAWTFPEFPDYEIRFDAATWDLAEWNNGGSHLWQLKNKNLANCVITIPRQVSDPFTRQVDSVLVLAGVEYNVRKAGFRQFRQYTLYRPVAVPGPDLLQDDISLIVYPGSLEPDRCEEQSEAVLATLRFKNH